MGNTVLHATGDHGVSCRLIYEGKQQTGNEKDPSAALGMTKRGNASFPLLFQSASGKPTSGAARHLLPEEGGRRGKNPSTPFLWKGGCPKGRGLAEGKKSEASLRPFGRLLPEEGGRKPFSRIVISSESEKSFSFAVKQQL